MIYGKISDKILYSLEYTTRDEQENAYLYDLIIEDSIRKYEFVILVAYKEEDEEPLTFIDAYENEDVTTEENKIAFTLANKIKNEIIENCKKLIKR